MVKNIPTIERSTKIRFGKHATDDQAENTIVFNASNVAIDASTAGGVYVTPMRTVDPSTPEITVLSYNTITKEIVNSDTASADLFNSNLHFVSQRGNVTSNTLQFTNPTTAFITTGGVGIGSSVLIDSSADNKIQVSGTIKTGALHADNIGISNTSPEHALSLGNEGQLRLNVPTGSIYALETVGNVSAQNYIGDGGLLSNVTLQTVTDKSNITSNTLQLTNPTTSLKAYSNIIVDGKITVGTPIETTSGGTGHDTYIPGTILYGTDTGTSLGRLVPAGSNQDAGKFLRLDASDIPEWAEVPLTLDAVLGDTTAISDGSMDLTGTGTTITTAGKIKAASFEGLGSELDGINAANVAPLTGTFTTSVLPIVPVTKGGTGLNSVSTGDILYASGTDQIGNLAKGTANKVLQMDSAANLPEWTSTITGSTLDDPTITGVITIPGLNTNSIPFTNALGELVSGTKLQFDGVDTMTIGSNLTVSGNLLVQGNTTFQHTQNHTISDPLIELGNANASDTIDLGVIMTRPTSNVVAGYMGDEKKYVIAYTLSDPLSPHIVPTNATSDQFMTLSVEGGNVLAGNVTTTGKMTAGTLHGDSITVSGAVTGSTLVGDGSAITSLDAEKITTGAVDVDHGGTNIASYTAGDLLYATGPTTLAKLGVDNGKFLKSTASAVEWADVSSDLQTITDGGATTTHTVAFNNATTGLTSAGDITIAATKKLKFADDILLQGGGGSGTSNLFINNAIILSPELQGGSASTKNVLSIDTSTGEIYDSGGQGGSTMEFTHEEGTGIHANVSVGPSAWAGPTGTANLTINTYGSNVLTVTGNVSATNITIGGLNVAASPFGLDDVSSAAVGANITSNVLQFTGPASGYATDNAFVTTKSISIGSNVTTAGNVFCNSNITSQNLILTNTQISTTWTTGSGTLAIDCKNKSYGTAPLVSLDADIAILSITNLPSGGQVVVPLLASGGARKVLKTITAGIDFIAFTADVSIDQNSHGLLTVSKIGASGAEKIYMNAISFTAA